MPILQGKGCVAHLGKLVSELMAPKLALQSRSTPAAQLASPESARSSGSKKRVRAAASSASERPPAASKLPEKPVPPKKLKARKALLNTLWSQEELTSLKAKSEQLYKQLNQLYTNPPCPLNYATPFQLLVAVILSAQVQTELCCLPYLLLQAIPSHILHADHRQEGQSSYTGAIPAGS